MQGTNRRTVVGRGEKSLLCDPGSELRLGGREKKVEDIKGDGKREDFVVYPTRPCGLSIELLLVSFFLLKPYVFVIEARELLNDCEGNNASGKARSIRCRGTIEGTLLSRQVISD